MTSKWSIKVLGHEVFSAECSLNQPNATRVCIRSINQSNRSISIRLLFLVFFIIVTTQLVQFLLFWVGFCLIYFNLFCFFVSFLSWHISWLVGWLLLSLLFFKLIYWYNKCNHCRKTVKAKTRSIYLCYRLFRHGENLLHCEEKGWLLLHKSLFSGNSLHCGFMAGLLDGPRKYRGQGYCRYYLSANSDVLGAKR